jgi:flagellar basal body-associated protein FliL
MSTTTEFIVVLLFVAMLIGIYACATLIYLFMQETGDNYLYVKHKQEAMEKKITTIQSHVEKLYTNHLRTFSNSKSDTNRGNSISDW